MPALRDWFFDDLPVEAAPPPAPPRFKAPPPAPSYDEFTVIAHTVFGALPRLTPRRVERADAARPNHLPARPTTPGYAWMPGALHLGRAHGAASDWRDL